MPLPTTDARGAPRELGVLSANVHGLFRWIAADDPGDRSPSIGWLARSYDVVLFQEDFEYHSMLREQLEARVAVRGNGMGWDPRRLCAKLILLPFSLLIPHFSPPYGAGLSTFVPYDLFQSEDVSREAYDSCSGWLGASGDCWARKGHLRVGLHLTNGAAVDVYSTHLQAGPTTESVEIRRRQLDHLAAEIERRPKERAL